MRYQNLNIPDFVTANVTQTQNFQYKVVLLTPPLGKDAVLPGVLDVIGALTLGPPILL